MAEAKDIDDSLSYLRHFEKNTANPDLGTLIQEKISADGESLKLNGCQLKKILNPSPVLVQSRS